ncbi:hypothetical protein COOONC_25064 [Cooperia oncophora]
MLPNLLNASACMTSLNLEMFYNLTFSVVFFWSARSIRSDISAELFLDVEYELLDDFTTPDSDWNDIGKKASQGTRCAFEDCQETLKKYRRASLQKKKTSRVPKRSSEERSGTKLSKTDDEDKAKVAKSENQEDGKDNKHGSAQKDKRSTRSQSAEDGRINKPGSEENEEKRTKVQSKEYEKPDKLESQEKARKHTKLSSREKDEKVSRLESGRDYIPNTLGSKEKPFEYMKSVYYDDKDSD